MKKVGIIVVTYNRKDMLVECIAALKKQSYKNSEILVIDNASTDGTKEAVEKYIDNKKVFYFNTGKNSGGAGGFNYGVREAMKRDYDYIWLMDDDTIADDPKALDSLVKKAAAIKDDFSFLSCLVKWTDGKLCKMNYQMLDSEWGEHSQYIPHGLFPVAASTFVGFFANMKIVKQAGLPIKEFFIYNDDIEYSYRLRKFKPAYIDTESYVTHKMKSNSGGSVITAPADRIKRTYYNQRNLEYVVRHYFNRREKKYSWKHKFFQNAYYIMRISKDHKAKRLWYLVKGKVAGKFFNPKVEMK